MAKRETHGNVEVEFNSIKIMTTASRCSPDLFRCTLIGWVPGGSVSNLSKAHGTVEINTGPRIETIPPGMMLEWSVLGSTTCKPIAGTVAAMSATAITPQSKYTITLMNKDESIEIGRLVPNGFSRITENHLNGAVVLFEEFDVNVQNPGYVERIHVYKDARLYASMVSNPVYWGGYLQFGNTLTNVRVTVRTSDLVQKLSSLDDIKPATKSNGCTCGTWITGGLCADYCDLVRNT